MKVHHLGYAVKNLSQSLEYFSLLDFIVVSGPVCDEKRDVEIAFIKNGDYLIELISPLNDKSPITNYLDKIGNTPYHLCYETDNIDKTIAELRQQRYLIVERPSEAIAINKQRVAFLYHPSYGLLELIEVV
jgi:methylmalonyl-CoA/ethylmalonyl-CoA epimerase